MMYYLPCPPPRMSSSSAPASSERRAPWPPSGPDSRSRCSTAVPSPAGRPGPGRGTCSSPTSRRGPSSTSPCCRCGCGPRSTSTSGRSPAAASNSSTRAAWWWRPTRRGCLPRRAWRGARAAHEPHLAPDLAGGVLYPQDAQVQPMLAAARMLQAARRQGAAVRTGVAVTGMLRDGDRVVGVRTPGGDVPSGAVVNAAGTWGGEVAVLAGVHLPVLPRRGVILVTQPLPVVVRHKVYAAEYVADVASDDAGLESSAVVEGTRAGTILIGASRERVGFERGTPLPVVRRLAAQAVRLFPVLADVALLRSYAGFRPYCPDHLPAIRPDPRP